MPPNKHRKKATPQLDHHTLAWLADRPRERDLVLAVWSALEQRDRAGCDITALRRRLLEHQPTFRGYCTGRHPGRRWHFPCLLWHQTHDDLLGPPTRHHRYLPMDTPPSPVTAAPKP